jgi:hypothetical protein
MDPTAFSLAMGILAFVLSYSCLGMGWTLSLPIAFAAIIATGLGHFVAPIARRDNGRYAPATEPYRAVQARSGV